MYHQMNKLVINFLGCPGAGKTVAASSVFALLKKEHIDAVLVSEFAKDCVVENNQMALKNQLFVWANQQYRIFCGYEHAQVVVTDSPILLGAVYNTDASESLTDVIFEEYHKYNNLNIIMTLHHDRPYSMVGRVHSYIEAQSIQNEITELLDDREIPYLCYDLTTEEEIVQLILEAIG